VHEAANEVQSAGMGPNMGLEQGLKRSKIFKITMIGCSADEACEAVVVLYAGYRPKELFAA
jgi:hypothetical protein